MCERPCRPTRYLLLDHQPTGISVRNAIEQLEIDSVDSESDHEYMPHSEDGGENSDVVELRRHGRNSRRGY
jgi:hypothetical protein